VTGSSILSRKSNDPVPVETRLQLVLAVLAHEMTTAEAARRHGVSAESINPWRNRFIDAGRAAMEDGMPGGGGARGSLVERRQRAEIQELKLALAEATVQLRIWQKGSEYVDQVPSPTSRP
jgi:transposase